MSGWQGLFNNPDVAGIYAGVGMIVLLTAIPIIAATWQKIARHRDDAALKQSMIERGMSAEEIERVLRTESPHR